jgi:hypothetical protein
MRPNQPLKLTSLKQQERYPAPSGESNPAVDGFERIASADPRTGIRQPIAGTSPAWPAYHEDT